MAASTGIVVTAGALALADVALSDTGWDPHTGLRIGVATVVAAFISAGGDKVAPGFGTGLGVVLLFSAVMGNGPKIANKLFQWAPGPTVVAKIERK